MMARGAVNRVDARRENFDRLDAGEIGDFKFDARALRSADPVALHGDDALGPAAFELFQVIDNLLGVGGGSQKPLLDFA